MTKLNYIKQAKSSLTYSSQIMSIRGLSNNWMPDFRIGYWPILSLVGHRMCLNLCAMAVALAADTSLKLHLAGSFYHLRMLYDNDSHKTSTLDYNSPHNMDSIYLHGIHFILVCYYYRQLEIKYAYEIQRKRYIPDLE